MRFRNVKDVADWRLCAGCGACAYACLEGKVRLIDILDDGIRPTVEANGCGSCRDRDCIDVCPGLGSSHNGDVHEVMGELRKGWGPILEIWEGYATDSTVRRKGSSGGLASAISLYCLERKSMHGVLHTGTDMKEKWRNRTYLSKTRAEILSRTGSRYSPASPCDGLGQMESASAPCVFVGKPCDVAGLRKAQSLRPALAEKVGAAIGIFCAGTPSSRGTLELLKRFDVNPLRVDEIRYRGEGWPGITMARLKGEKKRAFNMTYNESWGFLQRFRPFRCYLCPDGTSELADISCGDPWYRKVEEGEDGRSIILVRTENGRNIIRGAIEAGYVCLERADRGTLSASQENLLSKRKAVWGRITAMRMFFIPTPEYNGFYLFENWLSASLKEKLRSFLGTARRGWARGYYKRLDQEQKKS